jgi:hypothetical protein
VKSDVVLPMLDRIEYVTSACPDRCFASGQSGPLSIRPCHGVCRAPRKRPARLRATYHRTHGIRSFHGCYCVGDDQLRGVTREHKGADHTLAALKSVRAAVTMTSISPVPGAACRRSVLGGPCQVSASRRAEISR